MTRDDIPELLRESAGKSALELLTWAYQRFSAERLGLASSLGVEDQLLTDLLVRATPRPRIFTLDTGRLFPETHDTIARTEAHYGIKLDVLFPDTQRLGAFVAEHGVNAFYESVALRKGCCGVRKVEVLTRHLSGFDAWITGIRRQQATTRAEAQVVEWDDVFGLVKLNPLLDWTEQQVWDHVKASAVPYHPLHDRGFPSIGCAPCTRAVSEGEDTRAGRWWWEDSAQKECGLHWVDGKPVRLRRNA